MELQEANMLKPRIGGWRRCHGMIYGDQLG
jgi:hypothetical protein